MTHKYAYWRRALTPKGNIGKLELQIDLDLDDLLYRIKRDAAASAWMHFEVQDVYFKGSSSWVGSGKKRHRRTPKVDA